MGGIDHADAVGGFPVHKAVIIAGDRAGAGRPAVADDLKSVIGEEGGYLLMVGLQLAVSGGQVGFFFGGVLELDHDQRQTVDKEDDIGAFVDVVLDDGELLNGKEIVVVGVVKVEQPDLVGAALTLSDAEPDVDTVGQVAVEALVAFEQGDAFDAQHFFESFFAGAGGQVGVEPVNGGFESAAQDDLMRLALGWVALQQVRSMGELIARLIAQVLEH